MEKEKAIDFINNRVFSTNECENESFVIHLDTAMEAIKLARKEGADCIIEQSLENGQKKYHQGLNFMKQKAIKAFKKNCQYPKDTNGCECKLCIRWVAGHCELLDGFIEKLNS